MEVKHLDRMSEAEYLAFERTSEGRHEFVNGEVFAMSGGSALHAAVTARIALALGVKLEGGPCLPYSSDLRVHLPATGHYCYPDVTVICGPPEIHPTEPQVVVNPTLVVEVLSPSTRSHDLGPKLAHYRAHPGLQAVLIVEPTLGELDLYTRIDARSWRVERLAAPDELHLPALGDLRVSVADLFRGTESLRALEEK